jgi:hypothetical protein
MNFIRFFILDTENQLTVIYYVENYNVITPALCV